MVIPVRGGGSNNISNSNSNSTNGCNETSSNCVVWQGPDLPCIDVCNGDTISDILAKLCDELVNTTTVSPGVDISTINQGCLISEYGTANDVQTLITNIIDKLCKCCENAGTQTDPCSCVIPLPDCLKYEQSGTGQYITSLPLYSTTGDSYAVLLGNKICDNINAINSIQITVADHESRITYIEANCCHSHGSGPHEGTSSPQNMIVPSYVGTPGIPSSIASVMVATEQTLGELERATGTPAAINTALNVAPSLGGREILSGTGTYSAVPQFIGNPVNLAQSVQNLWVTLNDTRNAVQSMKETVANPLCGDITFKVAGSISRSAEGAFQNLKLDFQDTVIPTSYQDCNSKGTKITITDASLNSVVVHADVAGIYQNNTAYTLNTNQLGNLDLGSNYSVRVEFCASNGDNMCQEIQNFTIDNELVCPDVIIGSVTADTIPFTVDNIRIPTGEGHTISVMLRTSTGVLQDTRSYTAFASGISGTFSNLSGSSQYQVVAEVLRKGATAGTQCAIQTVSTLAPTCTTIARVSSDATWHLKTTDTSTQTKWSVGFDSTNNPIVVQDTTVTGITGWQHNGSFINDEDGTTPLQITGMSGSPMSPAALSRATLDSGWKYFGSLQDPIGNLYYIYATVNTGSHTIDKVIFACNCSGLYLDTPQPVYYCAKSENVDITVDAIGYTQSGGTYSWTISSQPSHGSLTNTATTSSQIKYTYVQDSTDFAADSFTISLTNDCGTVVSAKEVAILPAKSIKYTSSDVIVFFDTQTITEGNAKKIKDSFNSIRSSFVGSSKPNFYYVAVNGNESGDYLKHVKACVENIGTFDSFNGTNKSITWPTSTGWWTDIMASGGTLPAYWSGSTAEYPPDIKIISFVNNVTTSGTVGTYSSTATVPAPASWSGFGPTSSTGSIPYQYKEDYEAIKDIVNGTSASAYAGLFQGLAGSPWIATHKPFTFDQIVVNIVGDDATITAASALQMFAAVQGENLMTGPEFGGIKVGLRQRSWNGISGINLAPYLDSTGGATGTIPYKASNGVTGLKDLTGSSISIHAYIESTIELDNSINSDITTYFRGMLNMLPTGNVNEPTAKGYGQIGAGAVGFGSSAVDAPSACSAAGSVTHAPIYTAAEGDTPSAAPFPASILNRRAYTTRSAAAQDIKGKNELVNNTWYAIHDGSTGKYVAQYDAGSSAPHWKNITTC